MYWLDVAIIYFALGAPFGVLRITAKREVTPFAYLRMTSGYLLWPLVAIRNVARFFTAKPAAQKDELDSIRAGLEKALFAYAGTFPESESTRRDLCAFREVFFRYTGLAATIAEFTSSLVTRHSSLIPPFTTHHSPFIRAACIARRDRQKLDMQFRAARQDFVEILGTTYKTEVDHTIEALAQCAGDRSLINAVYSR